MFKSRIWTVLFTIVFLTGFTSQAFAGSGSKPTKDKQSSQKVSAAKPKPKEVKAKPQQTSKLSKPKSRPKVKLLDALIQQESSGKSGAVGDQFTPDGKPRPKEEWAYGPLQIRQACVDDVNKKYGTKYKSSDCQYNLKLSIWIYNRYMELWATKKRLGREPTDQDRARIWNGGPNGYRRSSTKGYWRDVQRHMK